MGQNTDGRNGKNNWIDIAVSALLAFGFCSGMALMQIDEVIPGLFVFVGSATISVLYIITRPLWPI